MVREPTCQAAQSAQPLVDQAPSQILAQYWLCTAQVSPLAKGQVELKAGADRPTPLVTGMPGGARTNTIRSGVVIPRAVVMQDGRDLRAAPSLIGPDVEDNVRNQEARVLPCGIGGSSRARGHDRAVAAVSRQVDRLGANGPEIIPTVGKYPCAWHSRGMRCENLQLLVS